jgi:hypothetical protein
MSPLRPLPPCPEWQADTPVLCAAGRGPLDEAAATMLAQLLEKHGLGARVEGAEAIASSNILRLETSGLAMVCLSYFNASYAVHHSPDTPQTATGPNPARMLEDGC